MLHIELAVCHRELSPLLGRCGALSAAVIQISDVIERAVFVTCARVFVFVCGTVVYTRQTRARLSSAYLVKGFDPYCPLIKPLYNKC